MTALSVI